MNRSKVKNNAFVERRNRVLWTYMCTYKFINVAVHREKTHNVLGFLRSRVERKWKLISSSPKSDEKCLQTYRLNLTAVYELSRVGRKMHLRKKLLIFAASSPSHQLLYCSCAREDEDVGRKRPWPRHISLAPSHLQLCWLRSLYPHVGIGHIHSGKYAPSVHLHYETNMRGLKQAENT